MKHDLTTGTWQDDTGCPISIILDTTSDVTDIQKLVGKLARLGEGAPWIYKIMSHIYTSLAFALRQNKELLLVCSSKFREIVGNIQRGNFSGSHSEIARELNFALKTAARMVNHHKQFYFINKTMQAEI